MNIIKWLLFYVIKFGVACSRAVDKWIRLDVINKREESSFDELDVPANWYLEM